MDKKSRGYCRGSSRAFVEYYEDSCRQMASTTRILLWSSNESDKCSRTVDQTLSSFPEDDIYIQQAASVAAMGRVAGAGSYETLSEFGAATDTTGRRRYLVGCIHMEVPTLEDQPTILRINVNHGHMPLQAIPRSFKDDLQFEDGCKRIFRCNDCETGKRTGTRRRATMPKAYSFNMIKKASMRKRCRACRVKKGIAGCRWYAGVSSWPSSSRLHEREP